MFLLYAWWLPQIALSAWSNTRPPLKPSYVAATSLTRLALPLYLFGCPHNLLRSPPSAPVAVALTLFVAAQVPIHRLVPAPSPTTPACPTEVWDAPYVPLFLDLLTKCCQSFRLMSKVGPPPPPPPLPPTRVPWPVSCLCLRLCLSRIVQSFKEMCEVSKTDKLKGCRDACRHSRLPDLVHSFLTIEAVMTQSREGKH